MSWRGSGRERAVRPLAIAALLLAGAAKAQTTEVALGIEALARRDLRGADAAFARGTTARNPLIHSAAWQWRGHVAWKFRGDTAAARRYLDLALVEARDSTPILVEMARLQGFQNRYRDAVRTGLDAMRRSLDAERRGLAARTTADLVADAGFSAGPGHLRDSVDLKAVEELRDTLSARVERFPGRTTDARALVKVAAALDDPVAMTKATRSYFMLADERARTRRRMPATALAELHSVNALISGGLFEEVALHLEARRYREPIPGFGDGTEFGLYGRFLHDLRSRVEAVYRAELAGAARPGDVQRAINARGRILWRQLHGDTAQFYPTAFYRDLSMRYGTVVSVERSRGIDELFLAHGLGAYSVNGAPIVVLDGTISSGFDDWLLDGTGGRAGWVTADTVYERRTSFTETPFRALMGLTDPQTIPGELFRISRDSVGDIERAKADSLGYFPGVAARMFRSGAQALLDSVKTSAAFTRAMFDNLTRTTIELHEIRHRADARSGRPSTPADDEFRAKIDEVTGAPLPRLSLTAILTPSIGDSSPHGQANRRLMIGLNRWIRLNGRSIANYDPAVPALLQLPSLSDAQLRAAVESMRAR